MSLMKRVAHPVHEQTIRQHLSSFFCSDPDHESHDIDVLARTIWGEARGEGLRGMEAVACVVINRVRIARKYNHPYWWGNTVRSVCRKKYQFSCWNENDPNYTLLLMVGAESPEFSLAKRIARRAVAGTLEDMTGGATHYHNQSVTPYWAKDTLPICTIGRHLFYRLEG